MDIDSMPDVCQSTLEENEIDSVTIENPIILSEDCSNCIPFPGEIGSTGIIHLPLSQEAETIGSSQVSSNISESKDTTEASCSASYTKLEETDLDRIKHVLNDDPSHCPLDFTKLERDTSESMKNFVFQNVKKNREQRKLKHFVFSSSETSGGSQAMANPPMPCNPIYPCFDMTSVSSVTTSPEPPNKVLNPSDTDSNESLSEMLSDLENWSRRGLDKAFNKPLEVSLEEIKADFEKDVEYGLDVMFNISVRVFSLMRASTFMPDPEPIPQDGSERGRNTIRRALVRSAFTVLPTIESIYFKVRKECQKLKLSTDDDDSENNTEVFNSFEKRAGPNILITNTYTLVAESMVLVRKQMEDFREKIRVLCLGIEELF